jgi:hypothetical protein
MTIYCSFRKILTATSAISGGARYLAQGLKNAMYTKLPQVLIVYEESGGIGLYQVLLGTA